MPEHRTEARIQLQNPDILRIPLLKDQLDQKHGKDRLAQIPKERDRSRLPSEHAQRICRARIAAPLPADVDPLLLP